MDSVEHREIQETAAGALNVSAMAAAAPVDARLRAMRSVGTATFLMTDLEGSTRLLQVLGARYPSLLERHYRILREAVSQAGGVEVSTSGDAMFFVFRDAPTAVRGATDAQRGLAAEAWPAAVEVRVRIGIHTGDARMLGADFVGLDVHRAARIMSAGHGGQILLSDATRALAEGKLPDGAAMRDLGEHRLKDLDRPEHLFQLVATGLSTDFPALRSLGSGRHNLPGPVTSFVGRAAETEHVLKLLASRRLVSLTGPGGTGKTRLAVEVAAASADRFTDGAFFVPLAAITDPDLLLPTVAATLGVREVAARSVRDSVVDYVSGRTMLVILDNFEQLIASAPTVAELLAAAPTMTVVVTSREPLRIAGEHEFPVPPLTLPDARSTANLDEMALIESVALFLDRTRAIRPGFELTAQNATAIAEICARLDGLPLALELAAARSRLFEPPELLARLERRLSFLAGGRDVPERQRTLRGAIDWSHDLLSEPEKVLFRRMSVFSGGCALEAFDAVCMPGEVRLELVDAVSALNEKSLVQRDLSTEVLRLRMLETIREYARERLDAAGEEQGTRQRHASFFLDLAERAAPQLGGREQARWLKTLDAELDNFRDAIGWSIDSGDLELGLRLAAALNRFWVFRNHAREGRRHLDNLLALAQGGESPATRAAALGVAADIAGWQGDYAASRPLANESLHLYRQIGDMAGIADQLNLLGYAAITTDPGAALELFRESIEAYRQAGRPPGMGESLIGMALPQMQLRNVEEAINHLREAKALFEQVGDDTMALIADGLVGVCARIEDDRAAAQERYLDVLVRAERLGAHVALTLPLVGLADLSLLEGQPERAAVLDAAQAQLAERLGGTPSFALAGIGDVPTRARAELGDERYQAAVARGRSMPLDEIIRLALDGEVD